MSNKYIALPYATDQNEPSAPLAKLIEFDPLTKQGQAVALATPIGTLCLEDEIDEYEFQFYPNGNCWCDCYIADPHGEHFVFFTKLED